MQIDGNIESVTDSGTISAGKRTAGVASSIIFAKLVSFVFSGIAFILVARILGTDVYGVYTVAISVAAVFAAFDLGLHYGVNKFVGEYIGGKKHEKINALLSNVFSVQIIEAAALTALSFILSTAISVYALHSAAYTYVLQFVSITVFLQLIYATFYQALVGFGNRRHIAAAVITQAVLQAVISVALAVAGLGALSPIIGSALGLTVGSLLALAMMMRNGLRFRSPSLAGIKKLLSFSLPIGASNIFTLVANNITPIVLGLFVLSGVVGNFGITSKTNALIGVFTESIGLALLPMFSAAMSSARHRKNISRIFNYAVYSSFALITPMLLWLALLSRQFTLTVFGPTYTMAPLYISIMSIGVLVGMMGSYATILMISANKVRKVMKYNGVLFVVQVAVLFLLTYAFKGVGAVTTLFMIAPLVSSILFMKGASKHLGIRIEAMKLVRVILASVVSIAFALPLMLAIPNLYIPLLVAVAAEQVLIYPIFLSLLGGLTRKDVGTLTMLTSPIPVLGRAMSGLIGYAERFIR